MLRQALKTLGLLCILLIDLLAFEIARTTLSVSSIGLLEGQLAFNYYGTGDLTSW